MADNLHVKNGGSWDIPSSVYTKVGSTWTSVANVYKKHGSTWIRHWPPFVDFSTDTTVFTASMTNASVNTWTGSQGWSDLMTIEVPSAVRSTDVAHITRARLQFAGQTLADDGCDDNGRARHQLTSVTPQYTRVNQPYGITMGSVQWQTITQPYQIGSNVGLTLRSLTVPSTHLLVALRFRIYYRSYADDDMDHLGQGFELRIGTAPVINTNLGVVKSGGTTQLVGSDTYTTHPSGTADTGNLSLPVGNSVTKVYFRIFEGPRYDDWCDDSGGSQSGVELRFDYKTTEIKQ